MASLSELAKRAKEAKGRSENQGSQLKRSGSFDAGEGVKVASNEGSDISPPSLSLNAKTPSKAPSGNGLNLGQAAANPVALSLKNATANDDSNTEGGGGVALPSEPKATQSAGLGSLGDIDLSDVAETRSNDTGASGATSEIFADEIPVSKPTRELPAELEQQQQAFISLLDSVYDLHCDPDAVKSAIQTLMIDMSETPHLVDLIVENDIQIIVRRMSQILGFRKASAETKKTKRATSVKAKQKAAVISAFDEMLGDLNL